METTTKQTTCTECGSTRVERVYTATICTDCGYNIPDENTERYFLSASDLENMADGEVIYISTKDGRTIELIPMDSIVGKFWEDQVMREVDREC